MFSILNNVEIFYISSNKWLSLPDWAKFYFQLGERIANLDISEKRHVLALAVPIRAFAAPLIGAGVTVSRANTTGEFRDDEHYLSRLRRLSAGASLRVRDGTAKKKAYFKKLAEYSGRQYFVVQIEEDTEKWIPASNARSIEISDRDFSSLPKRQKGKAIAPASTFACRLIDCDLVDRFNRHSQLDCLFISVTKVFRGIVEAVQFGSTDNEGKPVTGVLQDLLRIDTFLPPGAAYRSEIISPSTLSMETTASTRSPYMVIFDSNLGYVKWSSYWRDYDQVIILDRAEGRYDQALEAVNSEAILSRGQPLKIGIPEPPECVDFMAYEVQQHG